MSIPSRLSAACPFFSLDPRPTPRDRDLHHLLYSPPGVSEKCHGPSGASSERTSDLVAENLVSIPCFGLARPISVLPLPDHPMHGRAAVLTAPTATRRQDTDLYFCSSQPNHIAQTTNSASHRGPTAKKKHPSCPSLSTRLPRSLLSSGWSKLIDTPRPAPQPVAACVA